MSFTLYHYVHCPFCIRVRMAFGYLNLKYDSKVLPYDDEATPLRLTGKKMLPALEVDGKTMNESLDIIKLIDKSNKLTYEPSEKLDQLLNALGSEVHSLAMPYWIWTPEFTPSAREYFQKKKELKRGPFKDLVKNREKFIKAIEPLLKQVEDDLQPFYQSKNFSINDILIASHIWGLYVVPEFQFSEKLHQYLQSVKQICRFDYHQDFWS